MKSVQFLFLLPYTTKKSSFVDVKKPGNFEYNEVKTFS